MIASCLFAASYVTSVLIHIPPEEGTPATGSLSSYLPVGQRLLAISMLGHAAYLKGEYARAQGMGQTAMVMTGKDLSDPDDLPALCVCHVPDQPERSGGRKAIGIRRLGDGEKRQIPGTVY